ncbi:MAG TPA: ribosome maturation factor RimM [Gemmatimonadaceae bacterium]
MPTPELMIVGRLRNAHGIRGDVIVEPLTDAPAEVFSAGRRLFAGTAEGDPLPEELPLIVERARVQGDASLIVHFDAIRDRTEAEQWRGRYVLARADELEPPSPGEVYVHELAGMHVVLDTGQALGDVLGAYELPQGLALEVRHGATTVLIPFAEEFVASVDRAARRITVMLPEGFLE